MRFPAALGVALAILAFAFGVFVATPASGDSAQERYDKGAALLKARKLAEAKREFEKAVELDPKHIDARRVLASLLVKEGKPEAAAKHLEKVLEVEPENVKVLIEVGDAYLEASENAAREAITSTEKRDKLVAKAIGAFEKAHEKDPESLPALFKLGTAQGMAGSWAEALVSFEKYHEKKPEDRGGMFNLAQACDKSSAPAEKTIAAWKAFVEAAKADAAAKKDVAYAEGRIKALEKGGKKKG